MTTSKRAAMAIAVLLLALTGAVGWTVRGAWRLAEKNAELIAAIKREDVPSVNALLNQGADPNATEASDIRTPWQQLRDMLLHKAQPGGKVPAIAVALNKYPVHWYIPYEVSDRKTFVALQLTLIAHGADPNVRSGQGMTSLEWGCALHDKPLVQTALAHGAMDAPNEFGVTGLICAVRNADETRGEAELVQTLLEHGARVNFKDQEGCTALQYAVHSRLSCVAVLRLLLERGAQVNVQDDDGRTPLMYVALAGDLLATRILLSDGSGVNARDEHGWTALMFAVDFLNTAVVKSC